jgi:enolase-phosphatase E1
MIRAIVTDIEGTTSSLSFVKEVLFPYARKHMGAYVRQHANMPEVRQALDDVAEYCGVRMNDEQCIAQLEQWIDEDRKVTPLKFLQGLIWADGYRNGELGGDLYADAAEMLAQWHRDGVALYVFSSGSILAQKLLFGHTPYGDFNPLFSGYFDTTTGPKQEAESYRKIAVVIGFEPGEILFLSDIAAELDAAHQAGMPAFQLVREGTTPCNRHRQARDFSVITF